MAGVWGDSRTRPCTFFGQGRRRLRRGAIEIEKKCWWLRIAFVRHFYYLFIGTVLMRICTVCENISSSSTVVMRICTVCVKICTVCVCVFVYSVCLCVNMYSVCVCVCALLRMDVQCAFYSITTGCVSTYGCTMCVICTVCRRIWTHMFLLSHSALVFSPSHFHTIIVLCAYMYVCVSIMSRRMDVQCAYLCLLDCLK